MGERYANALAALRERYVGAFPALRGRFTGATWALCRRYIGASIARRERAHRCLSAIAEIQCIPYIIILKYTSFLN